MPELLGLPLVILGDATDMVDVEVVDNELEVEIPLPESTVAEIKVVNYRRTALKASQAASLENSP